MENTKKHIYLFFILISIILIGFFLWDFVNLPFNKELIGYEGLGEKNYHPHNDTVRFFLLIIFSSITYYFFFKKFLKDNIINITKIIKTSFISDEKKLNFLTFFFLIFIIIEFFGYDFKKLLYVSTEIDLFHEGLWLTPSINFKINNSFWVSSYIERGLGGNFYPVLTWFLSGSENVGSTRLFNMICLFLNKIFILLICKNLVENLNFEKKVKYFFFIIFTSYSISLVYYIDAGKGYFDLRNFLLLFFILILFKSFTNNNKFYFKNFILGLFSAISILWYLDIGVYVNILLILYLIFLALKKQTKIFFSIIIGIFFSWVFFYNFFSFDEITSFYFNLYNISNSIEFVGSIKYPSPLVDFQSPLYLRATKTLIIFIITGVGICYLTFYKKYNLNNLVKINLIFLYVASLITFKYALGRSDIYHIKGGAGLIFILFSFLFLFYTFHILLTYKKIYSLFFNRKFFLITLLIISSLNVINKENFKNIIDFKDNLKLIISSSNSTFLSEDYLGLVKEYNNIISINGDDCVQIFTDETALPYYLSKKSCTKYYFMLTAAPKNIQLDFINELRLFKPKIILYDSSWVLENKVQERLKDVNNYIKANYSFYYQYKGWVFYKINS